MKKVGIVMGSIHDYEVVKPCIDILSDFGVDTEVRVISAHRTPIEAMEFATTAKQNGIEVIISVAGKAAHLGGVLASYTTLPIIGLPVKSSLEDGLDSLLSTVQMPNGVPVATVAINGGQNAGLLAIQILANKYEDLDKKLVEYKKEMQNTVNNDNAKLQDMLKR